MKYKLLRDCPHGKAGSEWEIQGFHMNSENHVMKNVVTHYEVLFPKSTFSDWFEEIKEMPKFTKSQAQEILNRTASLEYEGSIAYSNFEEWLLQNTEK